MNGLSKRPAIAGKVPEKGGAKGAEGDDEGLSLVTYWPNR